MISQDSIALRTLNIDSRNRAEGVSQDFRFELLEPVEKPRGCVCWVTDISLPTTWPNISENENILYITEVIRLPLVGTTEKRHALPVQTGDWRPSDLITVIQTALDNRTETVFDPAVTYEVFSPATNAIAIRLLWQGSAVRYDYEGVYEDQNQVLQFIVKNPGYVNSPTQLEFYVNPQIDFTSVTWLTSTGETAVFLHDTMIAPNASVAAGGTWTITAGAHAGGHLLTVDPSDPRRYDWTGGFIRFTKWDQPHGICKFEQVDLSGNVTEFVEGSTLGTFENPTAGYSWQAPTSFDFLGVYPYQASSTAPNGTVLRIKSDIDASRKSNQLRLFYQFELPPPISTITTSYTTYDTVTASFAIPELNNLTFFGLPFYTFADNEFNSVGTALTFYQGGITGTASTAHPYTISLNDAAGALVGVWTRTSPFPHRQLHYHFQIPTDQMLKRTGQTTERSINYRLGNLNEQAKNHPRNMTPHIYASYPQLDRRGEAVYLCSSNLSSHTGVLPNGLKSAICRIPVAPFRETTEVQTQSLSQGYTEVGGLSLKSLRFSIRDRNGLPVPLENGEWSAQLVFGFPSA